MQLCPLSSHLYKCYSLTLQSPDPLLSPADSPSKHAFYPASYDFNCLFNFTYAFCLSLHRMTLGRSCTPLRYSRQWATCCALVMAGRPRRAYQISGWPCWVWLLELLAMLFSLAMPRLSSSPWTPPDGSIRKRWEASLKQTPPSHFHSTFTICSFL